MKSVEKLLKTHDNLLGKTVVLFGSTGGIGTQLSRQILFLGGSLITVNRDPHKAQKLIVQLNEEFPNASIENLTADLEDLHAVNQLCEELMLRPVDALIHNAGAYSIPRKTCSSGLDNVFQINFAAPYYITNKLLPLLSARQGKVVVVGSIAHNYSVTDPSDIMFSSRRQASLVYGNAKRYLMFSMFALLKDHPHVQLAVTHPGITFTNITNHYPKWLFFFIKHPMKWIFMPPKDAALCILQGLFEETPHCQWIGPTWFNVWGKPKRKALHTCKEAEISCISSNAKKIYDRMLTIAKQ